MLSPNSCGMLRKLAKLTTLWVTLDMDAPIQGTNVPAIRSVIIKALEEIFLWKGPHRSHRKKKPQINENK